MASSRIALRNVSGSLRFDGKNSNKLSQAKRCLFGEPEKHDQTQVKADLQKQLEQIYQSDAQKWNFNFKLGTPLEGRYCWEHINPFTDSKTGANTSHKSINKQKHISDYFKTKKNQLAASPHKSIKRLHAGVKPVTDSSDSAPANKQS